MAARYGTPFFILELDQVALRIEAVRAAFGPQVQLWYAMKANPLPALLGWLRGRVDGLDLTSCHDIGLACAQGWARDTLGLSGPAKDAALLRSAQGCWIVVEALEELDDLLRYEIQSPQLLRLAPRLRVQGYAVPSGGVVSAFGVEVDLLAEAIAKGPGLRGIHVHGGSECTSAGGLLAGMEHTLALATQAERLGLRCDRINLGGGFGISSKVSLDLQRLGEGARKLLGQWAQRHPVEYLLELGRYLVGPAGSYLAKVVRVKSSFGQRVVILDGGLNHLLLHTPLVTGRSPKVENVSRPQAPLVPCRVFGPLCTPLDTLGEIVLPEPQPGDLLRILNVGAYGVSASPAAFLGQKRPLELLRFEGQTWPAN